MHISLLRSAKPEIIIHNPFALAVVQILQLYA